MMEDAVKKFKQYLKNINMKVPNKTFISNVTGTFIQDEQAISPEYWANHIRMPVLFSQGINTLIDSFKNAVYLEVGPGKALLTFVSHHKDTDNIFVNPINTLPSAKEFSQNSPDDQQFYKAIGKLWSLGYDVVWSKVWKGDIISLKQVDIPGYQFERNRCWIDLPKIHQESNLEIREKTEWLYQPTWQRLSKIFNPTTIKLEEGSHWLVFRDKLGELDSFINFLSQNHQKAIIVDYSESNKYVVINENRITINPHTELHYNDLYHYLTKNNFNSSYIVHGWTLTELKHSVDHKSLQYLGFYSLFLLQNNLLSKLKENTHLIVLTNGINQVTGTDIIHTGKGTLLGALRVIPHEIPHIKACIADIGFNKEVKNEYLLSLLMNKNNYTLEPNFSIRSGYLWKEEIESISIDRYEHVPIINDNDIILISGGLGGIGLAIAKEIAKHHRVKFILVSRNGLNKIGSDKYKQFQLESLNFIRSHHCDVEIYCCDISQATEVSKLIGFIKEKYKKIDGVIHTAGSPPIALSERNLQNIQNAIGGKVLGAENILNALNKDSIKFFVMTSSLASLMGDVGRLEYCAANSYLDILSGLETSNINQLLSINWPGWSDIGMSLKGATVSTLKNPEKLSDSSIFNILNKNTLTESEGAELFYRLMSQRKYKQISVSKLNLAKMKQELFEDIGYTGTEDHSIASETVLIEEDGTELENEVAHIFCQILGSQTLSKHDNYFELGGNSLSAIKLVNKLNQKFSANINISIIFEHSTVAKLAEHVNTNLNMVSDLSIIAEGEL
jgi:NADP-dependent 3-hydroxy acid dehydrogenase YdfG/acyl carrier protein